MLRILAPILIISSLSWIVSGRTHQSSSNVITGRGRAAPPSELFSSIPTQQYSRNKRRQYQPQMQYGANGFQNGANRIQNDANGFKNGAIGFQDGGFQPQINPPHVRTQIRYTQTEDLVSGPPLGDLTFPGVSLNINYPQQQQHQHQQQQQHQQQPFHSVPPPLFKPQTSELDTLKTIYEEYLKQSPQPSPDEEIRRQTNNNQFSPNSNWVGDKQTDFLEYNFPSYTNLRTSGLPLDRPAVPENHSNGLTPKSSWQGEKENFLAENIVKRYIPTRSPIYLEHTNPSVVPNAVLQFTPSDWVNTRTKPADQQYSQVEPDVITLDDINRLVGNGRLNNQDSFTVNVESSYRARTSGL